MKRYDVVELVNGQDHLDKNLQKGMTGIIMNLDFEFADVMFFNPQNVGEFALIKVKLKDLKQEDYRLPNEIITEISQKNEMLMRKAKDKINPILIKEYDLVKLLVEDEKYAKFGIHKGDTGCVMKNNAVQDFIEVDFSGIDENGNFFGDCISVKIEDIKVI